MYWIVGGLTIKQAETCHGEMSFEWGREVDVFIKYSESKNNDLHWKILNAAIFHKQIRIVTLDFVIMELL